MMLLALLWTAPISCTNSLAPVCWSLFTKEKVAPVHSKQLLTYLKLLKLEAGLLINFGAPTMKEGLHRIVNNYKGDSPKGFT